MFGTGDRSFVLACKIEYDKCRCDGGCSFSQDLTANSSLQIQIQGLRNLQVKYNVSKSRFKKVMSISGHGIQN